MEIQRTITAIVFAVLWAVTLGLVFVMANSAFARYDSYHLSQVINNCAQNYTYEVTNTDTGRITRRPLEQQVRECIYQNGIKKSTWDGVWSTDGSEQAATPAKNTISRK